jgi:hypothetical protein
MSGVLRIPGANENRRVKSPTRNAMKYLPLGFSIASFIAAGLIALTTSAHALSGLTGEQLRNHE